MCGTFCAGAVRVIARRITGGRRTEIRKPRAEWNSKAGTQSLKNEAQSEQSLRALGFGLASDIGYWILDFILIGLGGGGRINEFEGVGGFQPYVGVGGSEQVRQ